MTLTAHQRIALRRRWPEARLEVDERVGRIALVFPDQSSAFIYRIADVWAGSIGGPFVSCASLDRRIEARDMLKEMLR